MAYADKVVTAAVLLLILCAVTAIFNTQLALSFLGSGFAVIGLVLFCRFIEKLDR